MESNEVKRQIQLLGEQGFGGFFMHSRIGLETPYMEQEWMEAVGAALMAARDCDMEAWFYDEDRWPSGFAGGIVPEKGDEFRAKGLEARLLDAAGVVSALLNKGPGWLAAPRVVYQVELSEEGRLAGFARLSEPPEANEPGTFLLCQGRVAQAGQERFNGQSYVDLMDPRVTQAFIESTYEPYKAAFADCFGPHAPGIFTDEPNVDPPPQPYLSPWTPALPDRFRAEWGYDLLDKLPLLFLEGEGSGQVRHDYWGTIALLFRDNFTKPLAAWCEANGLAFTGHYLREDDLIRQTQVGGAVMVHYPFMAVPGIDHLGRNINNPLTLKQVSSVAHQMGRNRVLCEIFGVSGHSMTFEDQKWIADFHFALGITFLNQHLTLYSMLGERKRDFPPNISWAQPYWGDYRLFNDYAARCGWFTRRGCPSADILLLHPIQSAWQLIPGPCEGADYRAQLAKAQRLNGDFLTVFDALLEVHRDFDLGDELVMAEHAAVNGAEISVGEMSYRAVVLPYCTYLAASTQDLLRQFVAGGGQVYALGGDPNTCGVKGVRRVADVGELVQTLDEHVPRAISITDAMGDEVSSILYQHRIDADRHLYFLANTDAKAEHIVRVSVPATGAVTVFDATSGHTMALQVGEGSSCAYSAVKVIRSDDDGVELEWYAPAAGSLAFSVGLGPDDQAVRPLSAETVVFYPGFPGPVCGEGVHEDAGPWSFERLHPNVLTLDYCYYSFDNQPVSQGPRPVAAIRSEVMRACGRKTMIQPYVYLTSELPERPVPVRLEYRYCIEALPETLALVLEQPDEIEVRVNGQLATKKAVTATGEDVAYAWLQDPGFGALDIRELSQVGENTLVLTFTASAAGAEVEEVYLVGDFGVWRRTDGFAIGAEPTKLAPGSWVEQGYPFYSGTMRYRLDVKGAHQDLWLDCSQASGSLLKVLVNGEQVRVLPWRPWVVDIGPYLRSGSNRVEIEVVSSLRNAFGPLHHKLGDALPRVGPQQFTEAADHWVDAYQFASYGLLGPVRMLEPSHT
jgi:hypothetical protein